MLKANKWLAVLCASASAISTVSAYNLFFSSNTADQSRHETAKQKPPNKTCELENANVDDIISDSSRPKFHPGVKPDDPPPPPPRVVKQWKRGVALPSIEENIDIYLKRSQKLPIEDIINNNSKQDDSNKKVAMPDISAPNLKINNNVLEQQSKDFVSCMNERFTIFGKKVRKDYIKSVAGRLEFVDNSKKNLSSQSIKDFSQQFNSLIPDSETKDFVTMFGGTSFQKGSLDNDAINDIVSKHYQERSNNQKIREISEQFNALSKDSTQNNAFNTININILKKQKFQEADFASSKSDQEKSNNQKIREVSEQFNALSKDLTQNDAFDTININILKKQKFQEADFASSKSDEEKSNNQEVKELKNQLSGFAKTSKKGYVHHQKDACKSTGSDSLSTDDRAFKHFNYSFDDDSSSSNDMFSVPTYNVNINNI